MNQKFLKGMFFSIISALIQIVSTSPIAWGLVVIIGVGTALEYFGKNKWWQSVSPANVFDWKDALSALALAIGQAILTAGGTLLINGKIDLTLVWHTIVPVVSAYIMTTWIGGQNTPIVPKPN